MSAWSSCVPGTLDVCKIPITVQPVKNQLFKDQLVKNNCMSFLVPYRSKEADVKILYRNPSMELWLHIRFDSYPRSLYRPALDTQIEYKWYGHWWWINWFDCARKDTWCTPHHSQCWAIDVKYNVFWDRNGAQMTHSMSPYELEPAGSENLRGKTVSWMWNR